MSNEFGMGDGHLTLDGIQGWTIYTTLAYKQLRQKTILKIENVKIMKL